MPPGWPGFEVGWGIASDFRGKGYAVEAARAAIDWSFATLEIDRIIHCIDRENVTSQAVARRLGARKEHEIDLFGHVADLWVTERALWMQSQKLNGNAI
jgi:RimJ/RimL family protein N-acetyltransferase